MRDRKKGAYSPLVRLSAHVIPVLATLLFLLPGEASAWRKTTDASLRKCFTEAGQRFGLNPYLLEAIALHESGMNPLANNRENFNESEDIGIMQINSWWLENELHKYGIHRDHLWSPCVNIHTGAWILAQEVQRHGQGWKAVGYYNARTLEKRERYISLIKGSLSRVYRSHGVMNGDPFNPTAPTTNAMADRGVAVDKRWAVARRSSKEGRTASRTASSQRRIIVVTSG